MSVRVTVEADGGSRGNPGPAGYGAVVWDADGALLAERSGGLGETTNNVAEYRGLIAGLEAAVELGATDVDVRMDSKLVVEQMCGRWKIKNAGLQPLAVEASRLVRALERVEFEWIPRERNKHADRLANEAMDSQAGVEHRADRATGEPSGEAGSAEMTPPARSEPVSAAASGESGKAETTGESEDSGSAGAWIGAMGPPTRLLILRHGQTALSVDRRYSGRGDVPLTELGENQAKAAAKRLATMDGVVTPEGAAPVISSPLERTRRTAQAVADATGGELLFYDGLIEADFGDWEGLTFLEASEQYSDLHSRWLGNPAIDPPNGESITTVFDRVRVAHRELLQRFAGRTIIVVSHVTPIKALLRLGLDAGPSVFYRLHLDLASLSIAEFYPDGNASVRLVNDTSHLI
ncbi:putative phosphoglycerate mutase [Halopolyspora algeriensis]|uniref:Putative phosphoglycerate mutase n=1 Tax=Halopolyspora algeriensis TaxID=1500506 RepID=A0A368VHG5_9ACTN|nr:bifunctional RNase H/acid phosphatase [Halopolyspora algeriensis]RCW40698.1 putative phosphoglycerate mutase [Halopolyspora algeriensis]TQM53379.1 putative phosphoglycerate mutase [Halopolyspora algeriensis]